MSIKIRIPISIVFAVLSSLAMEANASAAAWSDSVVAALVRQDEGKIKALMADQPAGNQVPEAFARVASALAVGTDGSAGRREWIHFSRTFEDRLESGFGGSTYSAYALKVKDTTLPAEARKSLLKSMALSPGRQGAICLDSLSALLRGISGAVEPSRDLRIMALQFMGRLPGTDSALLSHAASQDTALKAAACQGLGRKARENRLSGRRSANGTIFEGLKPLMGSDPSLDQVRVLAAMGEDSVRTYLAVSCSGSVEKIKEVFLSDTRVQHLGLIKAGLRLLKSHPGESSLGRALAHGVADPGPPIETLLSGTAGEKEAGLILLGLFPDRASDYEAANGGAQ